jgi:hypothetical protein
MSSVVFEGMGEFAAALRGRVDEVDGATRLAVAEGAALVQRAAMQNSSGRPGPNVVSGSHRRSFRTEGPVRVGSSQWLATVGPTMVYSRRLELGGGNWPPGLRFPYFEPAMRTVSPEVAALFRRRWAALLA